MPTLGRCAAPASSCGSPASGPALLSAVPYAGAQPMKTVEHIIKVFKEKPVPPGKEIMQAPPPNQAPPAPNPAWQQQQLPPAPPLPYQQPMGMPPQVPLLSVAHPV